MICLQKDAIYAVCRKIGFVSTVFTHVLNNGINSQSFLRILLQYKWRKRVDNFQNWWLFDVVSFLLW